MPECQASGQVKAIMNMTPSVRDEGCVKLFLFRHNPHVKLNELCVATIFKDGYVEIDGAFYHIDHVLQSISDGWMRASPGENEELAVEGVGVFRVHVEQQARYDHELRTTLLDALAHLRGAPSSKS